MPSLILLKSPEGAAATRHFPLTGATQVIGRDAMKCQIVIPHHSVSRAHARIVAQNGAFYIEDLESRNHTFVNSKKSEPKALTPLRRDDRIKICDFLFQFRDEHGQSPGPIPAWMKRGSDEEPAEPGGLTTIEAMQSRGNLNEFLQVAPSDRLRALLDISTNLSRTLDLDPLLAQIADTLFGVFKQADRCFVILMDETGRPLPKVVKHRRAATDDSRFSRTIVKKTLDSMQSYLSEDASSDVSLGPAASIADFKIRSVMCVPLATAAGLPVGAIQLDTQARDKKFVPDDLNMLSIVANLAAVAVEKARLHESVLAREKEQQEIELARKVQLGFLPQTLPKVDGYEFYSHYSPAQTVGGDYYDFVSLPDGRVAVVLGDVAGKGAALLVAKLSSEVRFSLLTEPDPAKAISRLNDQMLRGGLQDRFVTLAALVLDPAKHRLTVVNAGHLAPKLYRGTQGLLTDATDDEATGLPLGIEPGYAYQSVSLNLEPGDTIAVYTDGVTDALDSAGKMFGSGEVERYLTADETPPSETAGPNYLGGRLVAAVRKHVNGLQQIDDIAVVCFGRLALALNAGLETIKTRPISSPAVKVPI